MRNAHVLEYSVFNFNVFNYLFIKGEGQNWKQKLRKNKMNKMGVSAFLRRKEIYEVYILAKLCKNMNTNLKQKNKK